MFERSTGCRALSAAFLALVALAMPAPASAQQRTIPVPADAPTALTAPDGSVLVVFVAGSRLCFATHAAGQPRPVSVSRAGISSGGDGPAGGCQRLPVLAPLAGDELADFSFGGERGQLVVTGTAVAAVESKRDGKVLQHVATVASPLSGAPAELRFAFVPEPEPDAIDEIALLDATGAVRRAHQPLFADIRLAARTLRRGGAGSRAWRLSSYRRRVLSPTPLLPERKVTVACLSVDFADASDGVCDDEQLATVPALPTISQNCSPLGVAVAVLARAQVRRVTFVLGDGSRLAAPLRRVPGDPDGLRAGIAFVSPSVAIRRMVVTSANGNALSSLKLRMAPGSSSDCSEVLSLAYSSGETGLSVPGPRAFQAIDREVRLCVAPNRAPDAREDCSIPPIDARDSRLSIVARKHTTTVTGLVPAEVATVRLTLDDGSWRDVLATPIPGYAGQYASTTLLVDAEVPAPRRVGGYQLLDGRGRVLDDRGGVAAPALRHRATVLRAPGLPPLRAALATGLSDTALPCLGFGALAKVADCTAGGFRSYAVRALCASRRIVIWGLLAHADDDLIAQTADGREITARKAALPAAIRRGMGTTAALLVLPARAGTRRLILRGRAGGKTDLRLPPAAKQCGYESSALIPAAAFPDPSRRDRALAAFTASPPPGG